MKRYFDDTIVALYDPLLEDFTQRINLIHPAIQFTRKDEQDFNIAMLNAKISGNLGSRFESIEGTAFPKDCRHSEFFMACRATEKSP